jgi:hypothetical protein
VSHEKDQRLIEDCIDRLGRQGYKSGAIEYVGAQAIGAAAVRLASGIVARASIDLAHPLGFGRVPLTPWALDRPRVAVHVWDRNSTTAISEDIHDHCYDFVSVCFAGGLEHRVFRLEPGRGSVLDARPLLYSAGSCDTAGSDGGGTNLAIAEVEGFAVEAPQIYAIGADILHSAWSTSGLTVTVQFQSPIVKPQAQVYRLQLRATGRSFPAPISFTPERMSRALTECG